MQNKKQGNLKQDQQQFEQDTFLIKVTRKKDTTYETQPSPNSVRIARHTRKYNLVYFLLLSIIFIGLLIFKFQQIYQLEDKERSTLRSKIQNKLLQTSSSSFVPKFFLTSSSKKQIQNQPPVDSKIKLKFTEHLGADQNKKKKIKKPNQQPDWPLAGLSKQQYVFAVRRLAIKDENPLKSNPLIDEERRYFQQKYNLSKYTTELPMCIVVPSFNNTADDRYINNMNSILMQEYKNYHIVFIDDASPDGLGEKVKLILQSQVIVPPQRYKVIVNQEQKLTLINQRRAAFQFCQPEEIMIVVDGDDELLGRQVFRLFNAIFQSKKVWFVYTNYLPSEGYVGYSRQIPQPVLTYGEIRSFQFSTSHLRAYYTQLVRNIKEQDLKDKEGKYFRSGGVIAITFPMVEMAQQRVLYVPEYVYFYNTNTGQNNRLIRKGQQQNNKMLLRLKSAYKRLDKIDSPVE